MKTLLKLFLPTLIPYLVFARYTALAEAHKFIADQLTEISLASLMYFFRYTCPYLYIILFLTQYVIVLPIWDGMSNRLLKASLFTLLWVLLASLLLAIGISYAIWDKTLGTQSLYRSIKILFGVQSIYWLVNLLILFVIEFIILKTKKEEKEA